MKFKCSSSKIKDVIDNAIKFTSQKNSLSINSNVLFENNNDELTVKATDGKMSFISTIPVNTITPGKICLYCDMLSSFLKNLSSEQELEFSDDSGKVAISDGGEKLNVKIKTVDTENFPLINDFPETSFFSIPQSDFKSMIDKTSFAVSTDTSRYFLTGVYMEKGKDVDNEIRMVATDGRLLAFNKKVFEQEICDFPSVIIPVKFLDEVSKLCLPEGLLSISVDSSIIYVKIGNTVLSSSLITGDYPKYERVIPKEFKSYCKINRDEMESSLKINSVFIETNSKRIFVDITKEGVLVSGENSDYGSSKTLIPCEYNEDDVKISFNCDLLTKIVKKIDGDFLKISFNNATAAMGFFPEPEKDYLFILMPMQV